MKLLFQFATSILTPLLITAPMRAGIQSSEPAALTQIHISVVDREAASVPAGSKSEKGFTILVADASGAPVGDSAVVFRLPDEGPGGSFADSSHSAIVYTSANGLAQISGITWSDSAGSVAVKITATKGDARAGMVLMETLAAKAPVAAVAPSTPGEKPANARPAIHENAPSAVQPGISASQEKAAPSRVPDAPQAIAAPPAVSVVSSKAADTGYHSSHKKWIILAAVVAAAVGAGVAMGTKGKSSSNTASTTGVSVGTPSVSIGQP